MGDDAGGAAVTGLEERRHGGPVRLPAVVAPVDEDARGIVSPTAALTNFRLDRFAPSAAVARFVDRYWVVDWDLTGRPPHTQHVLAHPTVNVVLTDGAAVATGVATRMAARTLSGRGQALGIMFRPAGFRPFLGRALATITDAAVPAAEALGERIAELAAALAAGDREAPELVTAVDELLAERAPARPQPSEATTVLVERIAAEPAVVRVEALALEAGCSVRQLQRRFADHVGLNPKAVVRRYRLFEAAERARRHDPVDWADLAAELRYSDQPHLVRDFRAAFGVSPERYARACSAPAEP
jgi:AraC-like DNA-binding protein